MQITEKKFIELKKELEVVSAALEDSLAAQGAAAAQGDLSENEEYATTRANSSRLMARKADLMRLIDEAEVVASDNSPRITIGSTVEVTKVDANDNQIGETRCFVVETSGDTIIKKVLGVDSPLGKEIINGTDGIYTVQNNGGIRYRVHKVLRV